MRAGWIQNRFVPVEPILNAVIRLRLRRSLGCVPMKEMLRVDALTFDQILEKLDALEIRLNALAAIARRKEMSYSV